MRRPVAGGLGYEDFLVEKMKKTNSWCIQTERSRGNLREYSGKLI